MRRIGFAFCMTGVAISCVAHAASALTLSLNDYANSVVGTSAGKITFGEVETHYLNPAGVPYIQSHSHENEFASSTTAYELTDQGLLVDLVHHGRSGQPDSVAGSRGTIFFRVDEATPYSMTGSYAADDPAAEGVSFEVALRDMTDSVPLLYNLQSSSVTPNESFILMGSGGDSTSVAIGPRTGVLIPGHDYRLTYLIFISYQGAFGLIDPATATGSIELAFGPSPRLPLLGPAGLVLLVFSLGAFGTVASRSR